MGGKRWLREYKEGDEQSIRDLYKLVFGTELSAERWAWRYKQNPAGKPIIALAESSEGIVGQYALIPLRMKVEDRACIQCLSLDSMVHPDYRGLWMFIKLAKQAYELAAERGIHFIYGFPNENSHYVFLAKLNWRDLHNGIPLWVKPLNLGTIIKKRLVDNKLMASLLGNAGRVTMKLLSRSQKGTAVCSIRELSSFDDRFDVLWDEASKNYNILAVRDKSYLTWRYVEKPGEDYIIFVAERGGNLLGFIVVKCAEKFGLQIGFIMDMLTIPGKPQIARDLISAGAKYCKQRNMDMVGCLMLSSSPYSRNLKEMGFVKTPKRLLPQDMFLGVCPLTSQYPIASLANPSNWFITWGDHDDV